MRSGRFGIGAFAIFLLGPSFRLTTRHADSDSKTGFSIRASVNSQIVEIQKQSSLPVGTKIEVVLNEESVRALGLTNKSVGMMNGSSDWYCLEWPKLVRRIVRPSGVESLPQKRRFPTNQDSLPSEWSAVSPEGFDSVFWTFAETEGLCCNGIVIGDPKFHLFTTDYPWPESLQVKRPYLSIFDSNANLPLTTQRYELACDSLPFHADLGRDVMLSFIAHALVCGPSNQTEALSGQKKHPLCHRVTRTSGYSNPFEYGHLRWCSTEDYMVPVDPWLCSILKVDSYMVFGALIDDSFCLLRDDLDLRIPKSFKIRSKKQVGAVSWVVLLDTQHSSRSDAESFVNNYPEHFFGTMVSEGIEAIGEQVGIRAMIQESDDFGINIQDWHDEDLSSGLKPVLRSDSRRSIYQADNGTLKSQLPLEATLTIMSRNLVSRAVAFAAEYKARPPETTLSPIAEAWMDCLGDVAIPFEPSARQSLITKAKQHTQLRKHIFAWEKMKASGSKWACSF